ncbi:MAG: hypothetical protein MUF54_10080 [Polyangiaceae bacterium]|nr:hypothetical protein [Polyangiaceae bacterium]
MSKAPQPPAVPISGASDSPGGASPTATGAAPPQDDELAAASGSGAVGRRGVRHLATAFTRAVPIANAGDPIWRRLPVGDAGQVQVQIVVDDAGHIQAADLLRASTVPAHLRKLVDNTLVMLRAGTFALAYAGGVSAGSQILRIEVRISRVDGGVAARDLSAGPFSLGHEPPRDGRPGRAHFTLRTGEHVEVTVRVVRGT